MNPAVYEYMVQEFKEARNRRLNSHEALAQAQQEATDMMEALILDEDSAKLEVLEEEKAKEEAKLERKSKKASMWASPGNM